MDDFSHSRSRSSHLVPVSPKRLSLLSGRARSNTAVTTSSSASSSYSRRSPASSMTSTDVSSLNSLLEERVVAAVKRSDRPESVTKALLSRGSRMLRRQGSKFNIAATLDEEDEGERDRSKFEAAADFFGRNHRQRQSDSHKLKRMISEPFAFQHLTHTNSSQFQSIDHTRESDLVTEFSAVRASQRAQSGLKGIRAEDIHFRNFSSDDLAACQDQVSRAASPGAAESPNSPVRRRASRPFGSYSQPAPRQLTALSASSIASLEPGSSAGFAQLPAHGIDQITSLPSQRVFSETAYLSTDEEEEEEEGDNDENDDDEEEDDSIMANANLDAFLAEISATAYSEHGEAIHWQSGPNNPINPNTTTTAVLSPLHSRQSSGAVLPSQLSSFVVNDLSRALSEERLGSSVLSPCRLFDDESPRDATALALSSSRSSPRSVADHSRPESWEADIDYCYEHAAESNSNFDWLRDSLDDTKQTSVVDADANSIAEAEADRPAMQNSDSQFQMSYRLAQKKSLDPSPALEQEMVGGFAAKTAPVFHHDVNPFQQAAHFAKHFVQETLYEEFMVADGSSDRHFPFGPQTIVQPVDQPVSPRSSLYPLSKCNSQESLILSRAASIARKHRSSVSTTSVPELVHSSTSMMSDHAESIAESASSSRADDASSSHSSHHHHHLHQQNQFYNYYPNIHYHHHRANKSLASDLDSHILPSPSSRKPSFDVPDHPSASSPAVPVHDHGRSASEAAPWSVRPGPAPSSNKPGGRRKGRASYSLFPSAGTAGP